MNDGIWICDVEADGLNPTKIHVLSVSNVEGTVKKSTNNYDDMRKFLLSARVIIGHNFSRWDSVHLERLLDIKIKAKIIDSLSLSWTLFPTKNKHGLEEWGEFFGVPKPKIDNWDTLSYEKYEHRCSEDVEINRLLWKLEYKYLFDLYGNDTKIWEYLDYLEFKMYCAKLQEASGWLVDIEKATVSLDLLNYEKQVKVDQLATVMPKVPKYKTRSKPKRFYNKDGDYTKLALDWIKLCQEYNLPADHDEDIEILIGYDDPNSNSVDQIKNWLFSLGWVPETFKHVKNKDTGESRAVPQVSLEITKEICPSIKKLFDIEPRLELLEGLTTLSNRISTLKSIIESVDAESKTKAQIQGLTNTLRFKHTTVVNLPKVNKPYAESIRGSLIAPEGYILCGSDMSSLEDRIKQHFIFVYDPDYVRSMNQEDFDPHLTVAGLAGMLTQTQIEAYKAGNKTFKPVRDIAKNGNYACQYGAGVARLMITCNISREAASRLFNAYWELNWAVKKVASVQVVKTVNDQMWLKNPINGFYYSLRYEKDIFSTLVQGTASYVFDFWVKNVLDVRPQLTAQFHDEIVLCIKEGFEDKCENLIRKAIQDLNETLNLNRELGVDVQFGKNYGMIH